MPIGYVVNKRYIIDTRYDRYAGLPVFDMLTKEAQKRGYGLHISISAMTRGYLCEVRTFEKPFKNSAQTYFHTVGHKYAANPLAAAVEAMQACVPPDPLLLVLYLEAEAVQLGIAIKDCRAVEDKLDRALDSLFEVVVLARGWNRLTQQQIVKGTWTLSNGQSYPGTLGPIDPNGEDEVLDVPIRKLARATFTIGKIILDEDVARVIKPILDDMDDDL